ncbi:hypothetical protein [Jiangella asiatica]|uniref:Secreted protein n=1 Tax=Jiangella asiatica TaxID=2530372 RepID=A0A4V2Z086_9ACTN|nr:hypothetical protein [Jiangella asiatica]TDD99977.1 hypothetical protein E1269_26915 [Jiangella asiatica]
MSFGLRTAAAAAAATAMLVVPATTAAAGESTGRCSADSYRAEFTLWYTTKGAYDYPDEYTWYIYTPRGEITYKNNVQARVNSVNTGGTDPIHHTWISADNIRSGGDEQAIDGVRVSRTKSMYGAFEFVFDRPDDSDPRCTGRTTSV